LVHAGAIILGMRSRAIARLLFALAAHAAAADYPLRPLRMIMPNAPGSSNDTPNRLLVKAAGLQVE